MQTEIKKRDRSLDLFKGFLVIQMTLAHVLAFYGDGSTLWYWISQAINLSTFGGFLLAFGWGGQLAWFKKSWSEATPRLLSAALRLHVGFLLSATLYLTLMQNQPWAPRKLLEIFFLLDIPNYSQFLGSFTLATLLGLAFFPFWSKLTPSKGLILASLCIGSTLLPKFHESLPLAYFWTPQTLGTFPVFQYAHYWIAGILLCKYQAFKSKWVLPVALILSLPFLIYAFTQKSAPQEYGPTIFWITGAYLIHALYLRLAQFLDAREGAYFLSEIGSKALYYLIGTNLMIFALRGHLSGGNPIWICVGITATIIGFLYLMANWAKRG